LTQAVSGLKFSAPLQTRVGLAGGVVRLAAEDVAFRGTRFCGGSDGARTISSPFYRPIADEWYTWVSQEGRFLLIES
jgi:hypothetical protein